MAVMRSFLKQIGILTALALALPAVAHDQPGRSGTMEPLDPDQMDAARVPLAGDAANGEDESSGQEWLEEQRRRMLEQQAYPSDQEPPRSRQQESSQELTPFQEGFRDALINQLRNTAGGAR